MRAMCPIFISEKTEPPLQPIMCIIHALPKWPDYLILNFSISKEAFIAHKMRECGLIFSYKMQLCLHFLNIHQAKNATTDASSLN